MLCVISNVLELGTVIQSWNFSVKKQPKELGTRFCFPRNFPVPSLSETQKLFFLDLCSEVTKFKSINVSSATASGLRMQIYSPCAWATPLFLGKPNFHCFEWVLRLENVVFHHCTTVVRRIIINYNLFHCNVLNTSKTHCSRKDERCNWEIRDNCIWTNILENLSYSKIRQHSIFLMT
jgi:hypothetical protein